MDYNCFLCLTLFPAMLSIMGAMDTTPNDNDNVIFDNNLQFGPGHKDEHPFVIDPSSQGKESFSLVNNKDNSLLFNNILETYNFHKRLFIQERDLTTVPERNMAVVSNIKSDKHSQPITVIVAEDSFSTQKDFKDGNPSEVSIGRLIAPNANNNMRLKATFENTELRDSLHSGVNGLGMKSWSNGCRIGSKGISQGQFVGTDGESMLRTGARRSVRRRHTREVRQINPAETNNIWTDDKNSFLSNIRMESSGNTLYKDVEKWPDQQTMRERKMGDILGGTYGDVSRQAPPELAFIQDVYTDVALPFEYVVSPGAPHMHSSDGRLAAGENVHGIDKDDQKADTRFIPQLGEGNYYYDGLEDASGELIKRGTVHKNRLYSLMMQSPRHSQRVALQDHPRGSAPLRIHDKMERSQHKERPLKQLVSTSKETVCEPESDGTTPMRCPSNADQCLYDVMICDGTQNCPQGEDETFALCVLRHWFFRWIRKFLPST